MQRKQCPFAIDLQLWIQLWVIWGGMGQGSWGGKRGMVGLFISRVLNNQEKDRVSLRSLM